MQIPQLSFTINLGITKIIFTLQDINFKEINLDQINVQFQDDIPLQGIANNISAILSFKWKFQQQSAPYISDSGQGQIIMENIQVSTILDSQINEQCYGKLQINVQDLSFTSDTLHVQLSGGNSWLYESLMKFALNELEDDINSIIGKIISQTIISFINPSLEKSLNGYYSQYKDSLFQDNSFTTKLMTGWYWMAIGFHGQIIDIQNQQSPDYIFNESLQRKLPQMNKLNNNLVMQITGTTFNSVLNTYLKHGAYQIENNQIEKMYIQIVNTGIILNIKTAKYQIPIQIKGQINVNQIKTGIDPTTQQQKNGTAFIIDLQEQWINYYKFQEQEQTNINQELKQLVLQLNKQLRQTSFFIASTPFMNWKNQPLYDVFDDVIVIYLDFNQ